VKSQERRLSVFAVDRFNAIQADQLQMQDDIITRFARSFRIELVRVESVRISRAGSPSPSAEDLSLRGGQFSAVRPEP